MQQDFLKRCWDKISHVSTAWGLVPVGAVVVASSALSYYSSLAPSITLLIALASAAAAAIIYRLLPKPYSWILIGIFLATTIGMGVSRYNDYKIAFEGVVVGLAPLTVDRTLAAGGAVDVEFYNPNDFPIWLRVDRSTTILEGVAAEDVDSAAIAQIRPFQSVAVAGRTVAFTRPVRPEQLRGGRIDYHICYGRSEDRLTKGLVIQGAYDIRFGADQQIDSTFSEKSIREARCN